MALNESQQLLERVTAAKHILVTGKQDYDGDTIASTLAWLLVLKKMNKRVDVALAENQLPKQYHFLPQREAITNSLGELQKLIISISTKNASPGELTYEKKDTALEIHLTPKKGVLTPEDVKTTTSKYKYDLIIVVGSPDLESLGDVYHHHPDFFYNTPIINIDHLPNNEFFGQINIVTLTASSVAEILFEIFDSLGDGLIDKHVATCLYTGMVAKTRSFKNPGLTPTTLHTASQLITIGADREKIITNLYRTKSVNVLKLWGRALARIQYDEKNRIAWTQLHGQDFTLTKTTEKDIPGIIDELIAETPQADVVVIVYEDKPNSKAYIYSTPKFNSLQLVKQFEPRGHRQMVKIEFPNKPLAELERELMETIQQYITKHTA